MGGGESRRKWEDKRTADADRNTSLKSGQRRGGWETGIREGLERDGDARRDETVETSRPRHVNRSERRPRSTHDERESWEDSSFSSLCLSRFFSFFLSVRSVGGIREVWKTVERNETQRRERGLWSLHRVVIFGRIVETKNIFAERFLLWADNITWTSRSTLVSLECAHFPLGNRRLSVAVGYTNSDLSCYLQRLLSSESMYSIACDEIFDNCL